jgi:hypothetical protein
LLAKLIYMMPNLGIMSFKRKKTYKRKDGGISTYYYEVESKWVDGKSTQKHLRYLGKNPNVQELSMDPSDAAALAAALFSQAPSSKELKKTLERLGIQTTGRITKVSLVYNPPLRSLALRIE